MKQKILSLLLVVCIVITTTGATTAEPPSDAPYNSENIVDEVLPTDEVLGETAATDEVSDELALPDEIINESSEVIEEPNSEGLPSASEPLAPFSASEPNIAYVGGELGLRAALGDDDITHIALLNSFSLSLNYPVNVSLNTTCHIYSATGGTVTIYQTTSNVKHFSFGESNTANLTFENVVLDGNGIGGGLYADDAAIVNITGLEITNCRTSGNGGAVQIIGTEGKPIFGNTVLTLTNSKITNSSAAGNGGGVYVAGGGDILLSNSIISGNTAGKDGGGVYIENGRCILVDYATISYNSAPYGNGGGVYLNGDINSQQRGILWLVQGIAISFQGNTASQAYWIEKDSDTVYRGRSSSEWLLSFYDYGSGSGDVLFVGSISAQPPGAGFFSTMYNNYDVNFIGSPESASNPATVAFDETLSLNTLTYAAVVRPSVQSVAPTGNTPVIPVYNNARNDWSLKVTYETFLVNGVPDESLKLNMRKADGSYTTIEAGLPYTVYTATEADVGNLIFNVPWVKDGNHLLTLCVPADAHNLMGKTITTKVDWSLEITLEP